MKCLIDTETLTRWRRELLDDQTVAMTLADTIWRTGLKKMGQINPGTDD